MVTNMPSACAHMQATRCCEENGVGVYLGFSAKYNLPIHSWVLYKHHYTSNHRQFDCLFNSLFRLIAGEISKPRSTVSWWVRRTHWSPRHWPVPYLQPVCSAVSQVTSPLHQHVYIWIAPRFWCIGRNIEADVRRDRWFQAYNWTFL